MSELINFMTSLTYVCVTPRQGYFVEWNVKGVLYFYTSVTPSYLDQPTMYVPGTSMNQPTSARQLKGGVTYSETVCWTPFNR